MSPVLSLNLLHKKKQRVNLKTNLNWMSTIHLDSFKKFSRMIPPTFFPFPWCDMVQIGFCFQSRWNNKDQTYSPTGNNEKQTKYVKLWFSRHWTWDNERQWSLRGGKQIKWAWSSPANCPEKVSGWCCRRQNPMRAQWIPFIEDKLRIPGGKRGLELDPKGTLC